MFKILEVGVIHFPHPFPFILLISLLYDLILLKARPNIERSPIRLSFKVLEAHRMGPPFLLPPTLRQKTNFSFDPLEVSGIPSQRGTKESKVS
jgi:hypothetical protein